MWAPARAPWGWRTRTRRSRPPPRRDAPASSPAPKRGAETNAPALFSAAVAIARRENDRHRTPAVRAVYRHATRRRRRVGSEALGDGAALGAARGARPPGTETPPRRRPARRARGRRTQRPPPRATSRAPRGRRRARPPFARAARSTARPPNANAPSKASDVCSKDSKCSPFGANRRPSTPRSRRAALGGDLATRLGTRAATPGSMSNAGHDRPPRPNGVGHTLCNCMRQLMMPSKLPLLSVVLVSPLAMYSSYSLRWRLLKPQCTTCSILPGRFFNFRLEAPQQERAQHAVQARHEVHVHATVALDHPGERRGEPVLNPSATGTRAHQKVHQRPQLHQVVL